MNDYQKLLKHELKTLTSTRTGRRLFLASLPVLIGACSTFPKEQHREREGDNSGQSTDLSVQDEQRMTKEYLPKMEKEYPVVKNSYAQRYLSEMGQRIVRANGLHNNPYQYNFRLVDSKMVNAFALPAGEVFVTTPLLLMAENEAELAGVIGHEIGHIKARHTAERMAQAKRDEKKGILFGIGGAILGGAAGYGLGKALCKKQDRECLRRVTLYGGLAGAGGGLLIQKFAFMANSREDEMEADRIGFKTAMNAGWDSRHVGGFYEKLLKMEQQHQSGGNKIQSALADALSTHPPGKERVAQMHQMASEFKRSGTVSSKDFNKVKKMFS